MNKTTTPSPKNQKKPLRRIAALMLGFVLVVFGIQMGTAWYNDRYGPLGGYSLLGLNYRDKTIPSYWVNGVWGGNIFAGSPGGGGGTTCCLMLDRKAKVVRVEWQVGRTRQEIDSGKPVEIKSELVPIPEITDSKKGYLGVHFLPNNEIKITFQNYGAEPLMPIKEIDYGFSLFDDVKQKDFQEKREEF